MPTLSLLLQQTSRISLDWQAIASTTPWLGLFVFSGLLYHLFELRRKMNPRLRNSAYPFVSMVILEDHYGSKWYQKYQILVPYTGEHRKSRLGEGKQDTLTHKGYNTLILPLKLVDTNHNWAFDHAGSQLWPKTLWIDLPFEYMQKIYTKELKTVISLSQTRSENYKSGNYYYIVFHKIWSHFVRQPCLLACQSTRYKVKTWKYLSAMYHLLSIHNQIQSQTGWKCKALHGPELH